MKAISVRLDDKAEFAYHAPLEAVLHDKVMSVKELNRTIFELGLRAYLVGLREEKERRGRMEGRPLVLPTDPFKGAS